MTERRLQSTNFPNIAGPIVAKFVPIGDHTRNVWRSAFEPSRRQRSGIKCCTDCCGPSRSARRCAGAGGRSGATEYNLNHGFQPGVAAGNPRRSDNSSRAAAAGATSSDACGSRCCCPTTCTRRRARCGRVGQDSLERADGSRLRFCSDQDTGPVAGHGAGAARCGAERPDRQSIPSRHKLPRLRRFASDRHAAGARRLSERRAHQRGARRHHQLGLHPAIRHQSDDARSEQPDLRAQCHRRRAVFGNEKRL